MAKNRYQTGLPLQVKQHGPKPALCPSDRLILSHAQISSSRISRILPQRLLSARRSSPHRAGPKVTCHVVRPCASRFRAVKKNTTALAETGLRFVRTPKWTETQKWLVSPKGKPRGLSLSVVNKLNPGQKGLPGILRGKSNPSQWIHLPE